MADAPAPVVTDEPGDSRFTAHLDGELVGFVNYRVDGDRVILAHAEVDRAVEGRGIGSAMVQETLDLIRDRGQSVTPRCSSVAHWIRTHPDYADLVVS